MARLKPNIIKLSGRRLSKEEFAKIEKQYAETGCTGTISKKEYIENCKQNLDMIISYESETIPFDEYCKRLINRELIETENQQSSHCYRETIIENILSEGEKA